MSKIFVDQVDPKTATTLTLGTTGDTIDIPTGVTIANSGTATGFGTALTGSTNNTVTTVTAANAIQGETNLTFDGTALGIGTASPLADCLLDIESDGSPSIKLSDTSSHYVRLGKGYASGSDETFFINNNGSYTMLIDSSGAMTKPLQPAFLAIGSGSNQSLSVHGYTTIDYNTEVYDQNADFASNTTFTAPVAGRYLLIFNVCLATFAGDYCTITLVTSNRSYNSQNGTDVDGNGQKSIKMSIIADMDASDTASTTIYVGGTSTTAASSFLNFSGCLLC
jgi:hypothetical protein